MITQDLSRLSRKDLQFLHKNKSIDGTASDSDSDSEPELDDFSLHDLKNLTSINGIMQESSSSAPASAAPAIASASLLQKNLNLDRNNDLDLQSNSSSSAASTVIHNPNLNSNENNKLLTDNINLKTLELDPEFQNKLHRSLRISNANANANANVNTTIEEIDDTIINNYSNENENGNENENDIDNNTNNDDGNDNPNITSLKLSNIINNIDDFQNNNNNNNNNNNKNNNNNTNNNDNNNDDDYDYDYDYDDETDDEGEDEHAHEHEHDEHDKDNLNNSQNENENQSDNDSTDSIEDITNDKLKDYINEILPSPPSSPPRELDPTKLYALYDFSGPDPSHLPLLKNDSVLLLNDSDSYWWLVRKVDNNRIGFAPAEILETYSERLARLNCWKNEVLERGGYKGLKFEDEKKLFCTDYKLPNSISDSITNESMISIDNIERKGSLKKPKLSNNDLPLTLDSTKKTVSFAEINEIQEHSFISSIDEESISEGEEGTNKDSSSFSLLDNYQNDDSVINSNDDLPLDEQNTIPLVIPKRRKNFLIKNLDDYQYCSEDNMDIHSTEKQKSTSPDPDILTTSSSADTNSLISTPTKNELNNITASTCFGSNESLNNNDSDIDHNNNDNVEKHLNISKIRKTERANSDSTNFTQNRLESLKMLDDILEMYPEFIKLESASLTPNSSPEKADIKLAEGYRSGMNKPGKQLKESAASDIDSITTNNSTILAEKETGLHPKTISIFDPVFNQIERLDALLDDIRNE